MQSRRIAEKSREMGCRIRKIGSGNLAFWKEQPLVSEARLLIGILPVGVAYCLGGNLA